MAVQHVQHMQKALTQMNIQLANVIADVVGRPVTYNEIDADAWIGGVQADGVDTD
jgi:hypothetical protein